MADQYVASATRCEHGNPLRKSCPLCVRDDEITELKMQLGFHALNQDTIRKQQQEIIRLHHEIRRLQRGKVPA